MPQFWLCAKLDFYHFYTQDISKIYMIALYGKF